jgi:hypothetical protein
MNNEYIDITSETTIKSSYDDSFLEELKLSTFYLRHNKNVPSYIKTV